MLLGCDEHGKWTDYCMCDDLVQYMPSVHVTLEFTVYNKSHDNYTVGKCETIAAHAMHWLHNIAHHELELLHSSIQLAHDGNMNKQALFSFHLIMLVTRQI